MVGEVEVNRQRHSDNTDYLRLAKAFVSARLGRLGMHLARNEVETG
jgi:hypothetical protein